MSIISCTIIDEVLLSIPLYLGFSPGNSGEHLEIHSTPGYFNDLMFD